MEKIFRYFGYYKLNKSKIVYTTRSNQLVQFLPDKTSEEILFNVWRGKKSNKTTHQAYLIDVEPINKPVL